ncbi:MAG: DJ-1/PfpI family protein [Firmicutes bacterium]|nr:DJ-1/PfpI family protein [Bacillota bacterium]
MFNIGILVFPQIEELDFIGPFEVLSYINKIQPNSTKVWLISEDERIVQGYNGLRFFSDFNIENCPYLNVLVVPGGQGRKEAMTNKRILDFITTRYNQLDYLVSVCTGSLIIGATGLLKGKQATTYHSAFNELIELGGAVVENAKVVQDGKIITGAGVSTGIDVGLYLLNQLFNKSLAQQVLDRIEYTPRSSLW